MRPRYRTMLKLVVGTVAIAVLAELFFILWLGPEQGSFCYDRVSELGHRLSHAYTLDELALYFGQVDPWAHLLEDYQKRFGDLEESHLRQLVTEYGLNVGGECEVNRNLASDLKASGDLSTVRVLWCKLPRQNCSYVFYADRHVNREDR